MNSGIRSPACRELLSDCTADVVASVLLYDTSATHVTSEGSVEIEG